jgi:hypothetical protein
VRTSSHALEVELAVDHPPYRSVARHPGFKLGASERDRAARKVVRRRVAPYQVGFVVWIDVQTCCSATLVAELLEEATLRLPL